MTLLEELKACGCNVEEGISRLMNNSDNYERMLKKLTFSLTPLSEQIGAAIASGDKDAASSGAHTAKGITGNLSITPLYNAYDNMMTLLKTGKTAEAEELYRTTLPEQKKILDIIERYA